MVAEYSLPLCGQWMDDDSKANIPDYTILEQSSDQRIHFSFMGQFEGVDVIWDAELVTLAYYNRNILGKAHPAVRPFIDVGESTKLGRQIVIGLNIPCIDESAVRKTIIMIRQYKLLRSGRHEYGEATTQK